MESGLLLIGGRFDDGLGEGGVYERGRRWVVLVVGSSIYREGVFGRR